MLNDNYTCVHLSDSDTPQSQRSLKSFSGRIVALALGVSILLNLATVWFWLDGQGSCSFVFPQALYSPAQNALEYKITKFHRGLGNDIPIYERRPSAEVDEAWRALYTFAISKVSRSKAASMANKTWPILGDETNYMMALDVFHQLHCLDIIRQALHPDQGYPNQTKSHIRHCIGSVRQALMCFSDVSTVVWQWSEKNQEAEQRDDIVHTCRDFEKIREWAILYNYATDHLPNLTVYIDDELQIPNF